jgi:hypothetical protein
LVGVDLDAKALSGVDATEKRAVAGGQVEGGQTAAVDGCNQLGGLRRGEMLL